MAARYRIHKTLSGWYVKDTATGHVWTGLTHAGAVVLASRLNRTA